MQSFWIRTTQQVHTSSWGFHYHSGVLTTGWRIAPVLLPLETSMPTVFILDRQNGGIRFTHRLFNLLAMTRTHCRKGGVSVGREPPIVFCPALTEVQPLKSNADNEKYGWLLDGRTSLRWYTSGRFLSHSNSFGNKMEKDTAGYRAFNRNFIVGGVIFECLKLY